MVTTMMTSEVPAATGVNPVRNPTASATATRRVIGEATR